MKNGQIPAHIQIRDSIINDIMRDIYEPGSMLPKQTYYAEKFGVSRSTVRKAIDDLVSRNVLVTVKGQGTYVCDYKRSRHGVKRSLSFSEAVQPERKLLSKVLLIKETAATIGIARQLRIEEGAPVLCIKRLRIIDGVPNSLQISHLNLKQVEQVDFENADLERGSLFTLLREQAGLAPEYQEEEIRAVRCPADVSYLLQVEENDPVLMIFRTVYDRNNEPMEYCEDYECTDLKGLKITTYASVRYGEEVSG